MGNSMTQQKMGRMSRMRAKRRSWIQRLLKGTYHHFLFFLEAKHGFVPWVLERFFNDVQLNREQQQVLRRLPSDAILVYTTKFRSYFEYLFYHTRYRQENLPVPELALGFRPWLFQPVSRILRSILAHTDWFFSYWSRLDPYENDFLAPELIKGRTMLMPLVEKKGFYRRFVKAQTDPLRFLIELQEAIERPIYIVPHLMFFSKNPVCESPRLRDLFLGSEQRPGILRRLVILFRHSGKVFAEISHPLDLKKFIAEHKVVNTEYLALRLRRHLLMQHNRHRQSITGPVVKSQEEIKESILVSERLRKFMSQQAASRKVTLHNVRKQADAFLDEIAANYSHTFISLFSNPVGWLFKTMYDGTVVDTEGLQKVKNMSQKGPLILVPCHKSHVDYLILSWILYKHNMPCPHIAAGKNLSFWPMGSIFRAGGAFFLRRSFRGARLYAKVFSEYIHKLLEEGFNLELFIEGGRSRTGKLLMPKLGILTILFNAFKNGACDDMIFVPVFIGYDQIIEERAYLHEIEGGKKEPETLSQVIKARRFLKQRYGKIYINFHDPISLVDILSGYDTTLQEMPQKAQNTLCRNLGWRLISAIDQSSVVTPHALVAAAILNCPSLRFSTEEIFEIIETYIHLLIAQNAKLTDTLLMDHQRACEQALGNYLSRKLIEHPSGEKSMPTKPDQFLMPANKRMQMEYYKNNGIAYFVPAAYTALSILEKDAFQFSAADLHDRYRFLRNFFKYEFAYDINKPPETLVRKVIKAFIDDAVLMPHQSLPDTYLITSSGFRKLKLFARFLKTYFESYLVVLQFFKQTPRNKARGKDRIKKIMSIGEIMRKNQEIELAESLSKINFENGINFFTSNKVKGREDMDAIEEQDKTIRNYLHLI
jgi:glycerol-3-phosphate O-acyltransferase